MQCPLEINLSESESGKPWTCDIVLRFMFMYESVKKHAKPSKKYPLGPWIPLLPVETKKFVSLSEKSALAEALELAQQAILHPAEDPESFKPGASRSRLRAPVEVPFSPNVVRLDISGPGLPNLSFFDLPGVISMHDDIYVVEMIKNLVQGYINEENCLIIQTLTMDHDLENSGAAALIKKAGATERTIGVLTKPDRLSGGSVPQYRGLLDNTRYRLGKGYYVVLNNIHDVDQATARASEEAFFRDNVHFAGSLAGFSDRFGTAKLQQVAARQLFQNSVQCLPSVSEKIQAKSTEVQRQLDALPKPPEGNVSGQVMMKIQDFQRSIQDQMDGGSLRYHFFSMWHERAKQFRTRVVFSHPLLVLPRIRSAEGSGVLSSPPPQPIVEIESDDDTSSSRPVQKRRRDADSAFRTAKPEMSKEAEEAKGMSP